MNTESLFAKYPPREPLTTLAAIVRDWEWRTAPGGSLSRSRDRVVDYCRQATDIHTAVTRAVQSRDARGVMHNHQVRVKAPARRFFGERIWQDGRIRSVRAGQRGISFDALFDRIESVVVKGIGPVTVYDVAVRIGAYLRIEPQSLYPHAGVWAGWKALRTTRPLPPGGRRVPKRIPRDGWPAELRHLPADEVEDLFCLYRSILHLVESPK